MYVQFISATDTTFHSELSLVFQLRVLLHITQGNKTSSLHLQLLTCINFPISALCNLHLKVFCTMKSEAWQP